MDYEMLYAQTQQLLKKWKDTSSLMAIYQRSLAKAFESGDLKAANRDIESVTAVAREASDMLGLMEHTLDGFDPKAYLESGDYTEHLLAACREQGVDVVGTFPNFEMFPFKVRIDVENQDIYLDRKKISCMRPQHFVQTVKTGRDRLMKVSFNASQFVHELSTVYDIAVMKLGKHADADIYLSTLYKFLVPMSRARKEYDLQSFAFDLARLYDAEPVMTKDGRSYQFGPSRQNAKAIRILDREGHEEYLATIRFYA